MINLAVIGCGQMGSELTERCVKLGRARIVAIHDPDPDTLVKRSAQFDAAPEPSIEAVAGRSDVDAFLIASPGLYHYTNLMVVAPTGKPIYCEKPLCTTVARCDEMIAACQQSGSKLFVGQVLRLFPLFWKSQEIIETGALGAPRLISVTRAGRSLHHAKGWRTSLAESGGLLLEVNAHEIDYMRFIMGEAESVMAWGTNINGWSDFADSLFVQITFKNGGIGMLHSSDASPVGEYRVHIQCAQGNMTHGGFGGELRYRSFAADAPTVLTREDLADQPNPYDWELTSFFDWIESGTTPFFTGETGRANVAVAEAAYRSLTSGKPEPVEA